MLISNENTSHFPINTIKRGFAKSSRKLIFWLIFIINLFNHLDHGAIAACTTYLMNELSLDHADLGLVGSLVYLGLTIGSTLAGKIFSTYTPKWIVSITILLSCVFLYSLTDSKTMLGLSISRICCGFFQVFSMIYFPVWIDQFGIYEQRTIWLSFLQLGPALGTMLGYAIEAIGIRLFNTWRFGFYFQCVVLIGITALFLLTPDKTFSTHYKRTNLTREFIQNGIEPSTALYRQYNVINGNKYDRLSDFSIYVLDDIEETKKEFNYIDVLKSLLIHNRVYLYTLSGICCLLFIITGIEFWITDYMVTILKQEENKVYITFAIVCISAPTLGVLLGGYLIDNLGGYTDKRALQTCFHFSVVSGCCGIPLPFVNSFWVFVLLMWFTLFFGGSIMPGLTGILLASIDDDGKEASNSITHFCYNLIGYLPAPVLYGLVCNVTGGNGSRWGLVMLMCFTLVGMYCLKQAKDAQRGKSNIIEELDERMNASDWNGSRQSKRYNNVNGNNNNSDENITMNILNRSSNVLSRLYGKSQSNVLMNDS